MVTDELVDFITKTRYEDLPKPVREMSRTFILDAIGAAFGGAGTSIGRIALDTARTFGGHPQATFIGTGERGSVAMAAYVNAKTANALDFDDAHFNWLHIGPTLVPSALAVAQAYGCSGDRLLLAVAIGYDVAARLGLAMGMPFTLSEGGEVSMPQILGTGWKAVGAAAAAAVLMNLTPEQVRQTIGIAGANAPTPATLKYEYHVDRPLPLQKSVDIGWMAQAAVTAAVLAREGATGFHDILEGDNGFWRMNGSPRFNEDVVLRELGTYWHILDAGMKPYPSCRHLHVAADCFGSIMQRENVRPQEIEQIRVGLSPMSTRPTWMNPSPRNLVEAQFSLPHTIAMLAFGVPPGPAWHTDEKLTDERYQGMRDKVAMYVNPSTRDAMLAQYPGFYRELPAEVEVVTASGRFSQRAQAARGDAWSPEHAMSAFEFLDKFRANAQPAVEGSAGRKQALELLLTQLGALETMDDVSRLHEVLSAVAP